MTSLALLPSPSWTGFSLGPVTVHAYALFLLLGIAVAMWLTVRRWEAKGGHAEDVWTMAMFAIPAGIIGARVFYVASVPGPYLGADGSLLQVFRIWDGGLSVWGTLVFGVLAIWLAARFTGVSLGAFLDALAPGLLIGQAIGRLGDWFTQENFGSPTSLPWGLRIDPEVNGLPNPQWPGPQVAEGTLFHPAFLYESLWTLAGGLALIWLVPRLRLAPGQTFAAAIAFYAVGRAWIEALRIDPSLVVLGLRINVWFSLAALAAAVAFFVLARRRAGSSGPYAQRRTVENARAREDARLEQWGGDSDFQATGAAARQAVPKRPEQPPVVRPSSERAAQPQTAPAAQPQTAPTAQPPIGAPAQAPGTRPEQSPGAPPQQFRSRREAREAKEGQARPDDTGKVFGFWGAVTSAIRIVPQSKPATRQLPAQKDRAPKDPRIPPGDFR